MKNKTHKYYYANWIHPACKQRGDSWVSYFWKDVNCKKCLKQRPKNDQRQINKDTPREWFAVKRTKHSKRYQFYEPNINNEKTIEAIAPEYGNYKVIKLIEYSAYEKLQKRIARLEKALHDIRYSFKMSEEERMECAEEALKDGDE